MSQAELDVRRLQGELDTALGERDSLQKSLDHITGMKFSDRVHAALKSRAEKAEKRKGELVKKLSVASQRNATLTSIYAAAVLRLQKLGETDVPLNLHGPKGWWCPECETFNEEKDVNGKGQCNNCCSAEPWHVLLLEINEEK